jgi:hypothetical protein
MARRWPALAPSAAAIALPLKQDVHWSHGRRPEYRKNITTVCPGFVSHVEIQARVEFCTVA